MKHFSAYLFWVYLVLFPIYPSNTDATTNDPDLIEAAEQRFEELKEYIGAFAQGKVEAEALQTALIEIENCIELNPDRVEYWVTRGWLWELLPENKEAQQKALESYVQAVELSPKYLPGQIGLCQCLLSQKRYWSAIEQIEYLIEQDPSLAQGELVGLLAYTYLMDGRTQAGLDSLNELKKDLGDSPPVLLGIAVLSKALGQDDEAMDVLHHLVNSEKTDNRWTVYLNSLMRRWKDLE